MKINQELRHGKDMRRKVAYTKIVTGGDPFQYLKSISVMRKKEGTGKEGRRGEWGGMDNGARKREEKCGPSSSYCNVPQNGPEEGSFHAPRKM